MYRSISKSNGFRTMARQNGQITRIGRPTLFSAALADEIIRRTAAGESLRSICQSKHMPNEATVRGWDVADRQGFSTHYARARALRVERWAEEIIELADEPVAPGDNAAVQRARLRVDVRKWLLSKLAPRQYGDRVEHTIKSGNAADLTDDELALIISSSPLLVEHKDSGQD